MQEKRWRVRENNLAASSRLVRELGISNILAHLLCNRGFIEPEAAHQFLKPQLENLYDPYLMAGMRQAVDRIMRAIEQREKIIIYGDYDVDGTTSIIILRKVLEWLGADVSYHVPQRLVDGYGMKEEAVRQAHAAGAKLIISADCGIRAHDVVELANEIGVDVIVTDHHLPEERLPRAVAVLNPQRPDCNYPGKNLAGVGVAFKLVHALLKETGRERTLESFMKVAAIGTIADMVPLKDENRIIAKFGLEGLRQPNNHGLKALLESAGIAFDRSIGHDDIAFRVGPRINAMGRMGRANPVVELFWAESPEEAQSMARVLNEQNAARQQAERQVLDEARQVLEARPDLASTPVIVLVGNGWHRGVTGIAASKIVEKYYRPAIVISLEDGIGYGSGRSIRAFHLLNGLDQCADLFEQYGGHSHAAGLTIREDRIEALTSRLNHYAASVLSKEDLIPEIEIEHVLTVPDIRFELWQEISQLEPLGNGNPKPVLAIRDARMAGEPRILKERHLKFRVMQNGRDVEVVWWNGVEAEADFARNGAISLAFTVDANHYRGSIGIQLVVKDLKLGSQ
ncbi:MAG: single-stranded-DNA-specific exonuclease RecJ [Acidobacteria bacterium]|nr:single-stranded-DNA-specific exonuclease RecJ [Acidobacteriota bacterium]